MTESRSAANRRRRREERKRRQNPPKKGGAAMAQDRYQQRLKQDQSIGSPEALARDLGLPVMKPPQEQRSSYGSSRSAFMDYFKSSRGTFWLSFIVYLVMFVISCALSYEDYMTSYMGYLLLPTQKANAWVVPIVALIPQVATIGLTFIYVNDKRQKWAKWLAVSFVVIDIFTDSFYKIGGMSNVGAISLWVIAIAESFFLYTVGSEFFLSVSLNQLFDYMPKVWKHVVQKYGNNQRRR